MGVIQHGIYRPFPGEETPEDVREPGPCIPRTLKNDDREEVEEMSKCSVDGCEKEAVARGMCMKHYDQAREKAKKEGTWAPVGTGRPGPRKQKAAPETTQPDAAAPPTAPDNPAPEGPIPSDIIYAPRFTPKRSHKSKSGGVSNTVVLDLSRISGLREFIEGKAAFEMRTLNAQILWELQQIYHREG